MTISRWAGAKGVVLLAAAALAAGAGAASAQAADTVTCGETLTHSVTLANDLTNCPGHGLVVGADGITIDLDGHTIDGSVSSSDCDFPGPGASRNGIQNDGHDGLTIGNGTIRQFDNGVSAGSDSGGMSDSRVHHLALVGNRFGGLSIGSGAGPAATADNRIDHNRVSSGGRCSNGLELNTGDRNRFDDNRVDGGGTGIVVCCDGEGNVVDGNALAHTGGAGVTLFVLPRTRITDNAISDSGDDAIQVFAASPGVVVQRNTVRRAVGAGLVLASCGECGPDQFPTGARVQRNSFASVGLGIYALEADGALITQNTFTDEHGFPDGGGGEGIALDGSSGVRIADNTLDHGRGVGVRIGLPPEFDPSARPVSGSVLERNSISTFDGDGVKVEASARDTTLERNTASRNGADGIHVLSPFATLTRNVADGNSLLGIEAVAGVTDGGGNEASGNGSPAQCAGITCS